VEGGDVKKQKKKAKGEIKNKMVTYGNPKENRVCVNWLKPNEKCTRYRKKFNGKTLSFIGTEDSKKEALRIKKFRESKYKKKTRVIKLGKKYLLYSH